ncbi:conserved hypothetical protein [Ricinus communis]|uniref:Uncharacterized protein n=1 Tax=Ricinus communis TaxID=3988 RepID=B9T0F4_RICCO|nr:conserved hypothetical protein [Ricinus communis]
MEEAKEEVVITIEFYHIVQHEEWHWMQRSRVQWLQAGDNVTNCYKLKIGEWSVDNRGGDTMKASLKFYKKLYKSNQLGKLPRGMNRTTVVMVLKVKHLEALTEFRPINCINYICKVVLKVK